MAQLAIEPKCEGIDGSADIRIDGRHKKKYPGKGHTAKWHRESVFMTLTAEEVEKIKGAF